MHESILYQAMNVCRCFDEEEIDVLAEVVRPDGSHLSFSHLVALTRIKDVKVRDETLEQAIAECWTVKEIEHKALDLEVLKFPGHVQRGKPTSLQAAIDYGKKSADQIEATLDRLAFDAAYSLAEQSKKVAADQITEEMVQALCDLANHRRRVAEQADRVATQTEKQYWAWKQLLSKRSAGLLTCDQASLDQVPVQGVDEAVSDSPQAESVLSEEEE